MVGDDLVPDFALPWTPRRRRSVPGSVPARSSATRRRSRSAPRAVGLHRRSWPARASVSATTSSSCHSPERVFSGRIFEDLRKYPKLIGGLDDPSSKRAAEFYEAVLDFDERPDLARGNGVWDLGSVEAAELAKLAETTSATSTSRLANTFAMYADSIGVDVFGVIEASNSRPFSHVHQPGITVGGHCIPVYPRFYLSGDPSASLVAVATSTRRCRAMRCRCCLRCSSRSQGRGRGPRCGVPWWRQETAFSGVFPLVRRLAEGGAVVGVHDPLYTDDELRSLGRAVPSRAVSDAMRRSCRPTARSTGRSDRSTCRERRPSSMVVVCCRRASSRRRAFQCGYSVVSEAELTGHTTDVFDRVPSALDRICPSRGSNAVCRVSPRGLDAGTGPVAVVADHAGRPGVWRLRHRVDYTAIQIPPCSCWAGDRPGNLPMGVVVPFALLVGWLSCRRSGRRCGSTPPSRRRSLAVTTIVGLYLAVSFSSEP